MLVIQAKHWDGTTNSIHNELAKHYNVPKNQVQLIERYGHKDRNYSPESWFIYINNKCTDLVVYHNHNNNMLYTASLPID